MTSKVVVERIKSNKIIAVLMIDDVKNAAPVANALSEGGVLNLELTLRTSGAMEALGIIARDIPKMILGAGTVLQVDQLKRVQDAGVAFAVSPGFNPRIMEAARKIGLPFFPGVATPSDIEGALEFDCRLLKFFPAELMGGLKYLQTMQAPYAHLGLQFVPLGGVKPSNLASYVRSPLIAGVGGSWLAPRDLIERGDWRQIRRNAEEAVAIIDSI